MKFGKTVLLEIVEILRKGLSEGEDISQMLRSIDVDVDEAEPDTLKLSSSYVDRNR